MIISNPNTPTVSSGSLRTYAVDISKGAGRFVVFDTLIDGLYKNKIRIVIQEYSSNAKDANIEAGRPDEPIEIQLPTQDIPKFAVRDFGLGISPERMGDVFCNLGESTKRDGNAQTGGFGLGAKCGYAYAKISTGKFRIISVFGTTKYTYVAYINEGAPYIDLVDEEPTDERTGTTIIMDVRSGHISEFNSHAYDIFKHWSVRPVFHGYTPNFSKYDSDIIRHEGPVKVCRGNDVRGMYVVIAGIPYELRESGYYYRTKLCGTIEIPNGELTLTRSREDIEGTDANRKIIERHIDTIKDVSRKIAAEKIAACKNIFEAKRIADTVWHDSSLSSSMVTLLQIPTSLGLVQSCPLRPPRELSIFRCPCLVLVVLILN